MGFGSFIKDQFLDLIEYVGLADERGLWREEFRLERRRRSRLYEEAHSKEKARERACLEVLEEA